MNPNRLLGAFRANGAYVALIVLVLATFALGGSSREDELALLVLRPIAIVALAVGLLYLDREKILIHRSLLIFAGLAVGLVAIQLIPLPPFIWQFLPGRAPLRDAVVIAGHPDVWQPFAMVPWRATNALFAMAVPVATIVLAVSCSSKQRAALLRLVGALVLVGSFLALMQVLSPGSSMFRLYALNDTEVATGVFANRNHQAALLACAVAIFAALASLNAAKGPLAGAWRLGLATAVLAVAAMLVLSGSRAGLVLLALVLPLSLLILPRDWIAALRSPSRRTLVIGGVVLAAIVAASVVAVVYLARINSIQRLAGTNTGEELRFYIWGPILEMARTYFPVGSGAGSFVEVYQIGEPNALLQRSYVNHAHNDWIEPLLEGGAIAFAMMTYAVWNYLRAARNALFLPRRETVMARTGAIILLLLAVASLVDYPLRTPLLACLAALAAVWMITRDDVPRGNG